jgi:AraC-like DNA-binding protein
MQRHVNGQRVPYYQPPDLAGESFRLLEIQGHASGCSWHYHPEFQLSCVISGRGERVVGDSLCPIKAGEVTLLGANLPHVWRYDDRALDLDRTHIVVIHFREEFLGSEFFRKPEARDIRLLMARAALGLQAQGDTREKSAELICAMRQNSGFQRVLDLLAVLHLLAGSNELTELCSTGFHSFSADLQVERLRRVCDHIQRHFHEHLDRDAVARIAHLSPSAFSRFFKAGTGKTFQEFVTEVRVGYACRQLLEAEFNVTEIALRCGFADVSTFDRSFHRVKRMSPREFRRRMESVTELGEPPLAVGNPRRFAPAAKDRTPDAKTAAGPIGKDDAL